MSDMRIVALIRELASAQRAGDRERAARVRRQLVAARVLVTM